MEETAPELAGALEQVEEAARLSHGGATFAVIGAFYRAILAMESGEAPPASEADAEGLSPDLTALSMVLGALGRDLEYQRLALRVLESHFPRLAVE